MAKKRVLIIYATAGTGHRKAAFAIKGAFDQIGGDVSVDIIDSLDYTNASFRWFYPRVYIFLVNRIPIIWGLGYYLLDNKIFYSLVSWIRHLTNWMNGRRLARYLHEQNYDIIITTHFLAPDVISIEGKDRIRSRLINVITDYRTHSFWVVKGVDVYVVGHNDTKNDLIRKYGIPEEKIRVLGIPVDPLFSEHKDKVRLCAELDIRKDLFTVLVGSGGFGVGPIIELVKSFKGISIPMQLLVVCGKNEPLCVETKNLEGDVGVTIKSYGFIDNMDELMEISDVIITKTGGMMSSEALSKNLPIISIASIPGQETRNFKVLVKSGVVLEAKDIKEVPGIVTNLYKDRGLMGSLKERIESVRRPEAAYNIARLALELLHG